MAYTNSPSRRPAWLWPPGSCQRAGLWPDPISLPVAAPVPTQPTVRNTLWLLETGDSPHTPSRSLYQRGDRNDLGPVTISSTDTRQTELILLLSQRPTDHELIELPCALLYPQARPKGTTSSGTPAGPSWVSGAPQGPVPGCPSPRPLPEKQSCPQM